MHGGAFLVGIIVLFFALWLVGGGPSRPISFQGPYLTPIQDYGDAPEAYGGERAPGRPGVIGEWLGGAEGALATGEASPARGAVTLSRSVAGARASDPEEEHIVIRLAATAGAKVAVTGWKLVSESTGASASIPGGAAVLRAGSVNQAGPIELSPGDEAIVTTGRSPVGGSFRENLCTGYLGSLQDFAPPLDAQCPTPLEEYEDAGGTERECEDFVSSLPYCATETRVPSGLSDACERFVEERLSYNGCAAAHSGDEGFELSTWRIYLGQRAALWDDDRDSIRLVDADGKVVDVLSY